MSDELERGARPEKGTGSGEVTENPRETDPQSEAREDSSASSAELRVAELEAEVRAKNEEAAKNLDLYLRERADSDNFRKRLQRDKAEAIRLANEGLIRDVLPLLDNLERALEHAELGGNGKSVVEGIQMIVKMFRDLLERYGVKAVEAGSGAVFNPAIHEASGVEADPQFEPNTVIRQEAKGYQLHDRLLRPVRVVVAAGGRRSSEEDQ